MPENFTDSYPRCGVRFIHGVMSAWLVLAAPGIGLLQASTLPAKPTSRTVTCLESNCHTGLDTAKVTHGPVTQGKCEACHEYISPTEHTFKLTRPDDQLCQTCHTQEDRDVVHSPVQQGRCTECHDPHGSDYRMMLVDDPTRGLCVKCHKQDGFSQKKFQHGPVASGACILCHEPHSSWEPNLLVDKPQNLCLTCHGQDLRGESGQQRHTHAPVKDGCTECHDAHASDFKYQLHQDAPGLCFTCHQELKEDLASAPVVHGALTEPGGCLGCHAPHNSPLPKLQRASQTQMCLGCHNKPMQTDDGRTLTDMAELLADNPDHHGPIREDSCTACHQPHTGDQPNMLVKAYPPQFYAPFSIERYELCFTCHQPALVQNRHGKGLTRFRNNEQNLHWVHVNQKKGRTCRACHEVHASSNPFHVRDAVPFGDSDWMLEIKFKTTPTGGSCSPGCHDTRVYDREIVRGDGARDQPADKTAYNTGGSP